MKYYMILTPKQELSSYTMSFKRDVAQHMVQHWSKILCSTGKINNCDKDRLHGELSRFSGFLVYHIGGSLSEKRREDGELIKVLKIAKILYQSELRPKLIRSDEPLNGVLLETSAIFHILAVHYLLIFVLYFTLPTQRYSL